MHAASQWHAEPSACLSAVRSAMTAHRLDMSSTPACNSVTHVQTLKESMSLTQTQRSQLCGVTLECVEVSAFLGGAGPLSLSPLSTMARACHGGC